MRATMERTAINGTSIGRRAVMDLRSDDGTTVLVASCQKLENKITTEEIESARMDLRIKADQQKYFY